MVVMREARYEPASQCAEDRDFCRGLIIDRFGCFVGPWLGAVVCASGSRDRVF
jgi:hypothetical protein